MLALLDSLKLFHEKCDAHTFREGASPCQILAAVPPLTRKGRRITACLQCDGQRNCTGARKSLEGDTRALGKPGCKASFTRMSE